MESNDDDCYGPALPPHLIKDSAKPLPSAPVVVMGPIGPTLPPNFKIPDMCQPSVPTQYTSDSESDSEDDVGPMPMDSDRITKAQLELEERALEYQIMGVPSASTSKADGGREEWMIELPEVKTVTDLGLGARQFRTSEGPDFSDRTSWTDTPNTVKVKKVVKPEETTARRMASIQERERDKAMEKMKRKHEKKHKRDKSLLELHEKKLKKKKKKHKDDKPERRPFSRDTDLGVNTVDEAKRKAAIKSSSLLDNRFGSGSNKFL